MGPDANPVHRKRLKLHRALRLQRHDALRQDPVRHAIVGRPEVRQRVVVHPHIAAQPHIGKVALAQPLDLARRAHRINQGVNPQRQKQRRINGSPSGRAAAGLDRRGQRRKILGHGPVPHQPGLVARRQQSIKVNRPHSNLAPLGPQKPRLPRESLRARWLHGVRKSLEQSSISHGNLHIISVRMNIVGPGKTATTIRKTHSL